MTKSGNIHIGYRIVAIQLTVGMLIGLNTTPAQAIFGLSSCEKMIKQINEEEKVRRTLTSTFSKLYKLNLNNSVSGFDDKSGVSYKLIRQSDLKILEVMNKNQKCFTPGETSYLRGELDFAKLEIKMMTKNSGWQSEYQRSIRSKYQPMLSEIKGKTEPKVHQ